MPVRAQTALRRLRHLVAFASICGLPEVSACPGGSVLIRNYGYLEVRPPSRLFEPGAMIVITRQRPLEAAFICGPRSSLGTEHAAQRSRTMGQALSKLNKTSFNMEAQFMDAITGDARFNKINRIVMEIDNARIEDVRDETVMIGRRRRHRDCRDSIAMRVEAGFKPVMISSALSGDMRFHIEWKREAKLSARAKVEALSQLAVEMGGGAESVTESTIHVSNLIFGIRYSRYLAALSMPDNTGSVNLDDQLPPPQEVTPRLARSQSILIDPIPDAPILLPPGVDPTSVTWVDRDNVRHFNMPLPPLSEGAPIFAPNRPPTRATVDRIRASLTSEEGDELRECLRGKQD